MTSTRMARISLLCMLLLMNYALSSSSPLISKAQTHPAANNNGSKSGLASIKDLQGDGKEIACGTREGRCTSSFSASRWTNWLINCPYRNPARMGNLKFNFSDLAYLHRRYGNAFAAFVSPAFTAFAQNYDGTIRVWVYRGAKIDNLGTDNLEDEWGVSDRVIYANKLPASVGGNGPLLLPSVPGAVRIQPRPEDQPLLLPQAQNPTTLLINRHNPVEVDAAIIVNNAFVRMHGRLNGLANAREYMNYMVASQDVAGQPKLVNKEN